MITLGDRMKQYEYVTRTYLMHRTPAVIRIDGKAFHTWTRWCEKPFDNSLSELMIQTTKYLVDNIQGAVFGYTQSDEISILVRDYDTLETSMWFDGNIQKIVSISASLATAFFNKLAPLYTTEKLPLAFFDARVNSYPKEEVCNYFIWRQQDILRNSIQGLGQYHLGQRTIHGLKNQEVIELLQERKNINVDDIPLKFRRGIGYVADGYVYYDLPLFTHDREFIDRHVYLKEETNNE